MTSAESTLRLVIVGDAGHGKSTLIGRLLHDTRSLPDALLQRATVPGSAAPQFDRLPEELATATTEIVFRSADRDYAVLDIPGHAEFLQRMLTGIPRPDAALLVLDAAEGIGQETIARYSVLRLLGLRHILPVANKMDRVDYSCERFAAVVTSLRRLGLELPCAVPVSALRGDNILRLSERMPWHPGPTLLDALASIWVIRPVERLRFAIRGTSEAQGRRLLLGRVESGTLRRGQSVVLMPARTETTVASVEVSGAARDRAGAGEEAAIALPSPLDAPCGTIVCEPMGLPDISPSLVCRLFWLSDEPLALGEGLDVRIATQEVPARVRMIRESFPASAPLGVRPQAEALACGEIALVALSLSGLVACDPVSRENALGRVALVRRGEVVGAGILPDLPARPPDP